MSTERRDVVAEGSSSGKSNPNWSRMEEGGGTERGSTGEYILLRNLVRGSCYLLMVTASDIFCVFVYVCVCGVCVGRAIGCQGKKKMYILLKTRRCVC